MCYNMLKSADEWWVKYFEVDRKVKSYSENRCLLWALTDCTSVGGFDFSDFWLTFKWKFEKKNPGFLEF